MAMSYTQADNKYAAQRETIVGATHSGTVPATYLTAQVPGGHDSGSPNVMPGQHMADSGMNAVVNQMGGLGLNGQSTMLPQGYVTPDGRYFMSYATTGVPAGVPTFPGYGQMHDHQYMPGMAPTMGLPMPFVQVHAGRTGGVSERSDMSSKDVPSLDNRRSSYSTTESTPATPFYGGLATRDQPAHVAVSDRSTYTTPSPQQVVANGAVQPPKGFFSISGPLNTDLDALLKREPAIPPAVPAVFTPQENMKTLEQSLINPIPGNRNVYIRGLHPTTDDETLKSYADRFGAVETSKAIIDNATGACKGFGFSKFMDVRDSEMCIRGFYRLGYEESFNSRLKAEGDEDSTNLYLSNLPKSLTELELPAIFVNANILSSKILRDNLGNSRGVGFARFENRDICDVIIKEFNGIRLGEEGLPMQIRYADTPAQKELKRVTAERRQFRTNEYNVGAYGTPLVGMPATIYGQPRFRPAAATRGPGSGYRNAGGVGNPTHELGSVAPDNTASSEDGSGDEGVTIHVDSPLVANGSSQSSPVKQEKK